LRKIAEYKRAKKLYERALKIDEKVYGPDHPTVATMANNLGGVLNDLGELQEARKLYERALKIRREKLGEDHPATKRSAKNLNAIDKI
jgi:tetratricopeptide (TPR) repeat protein